MYEVLLNSLINRYSSTYDEGSEHLIFLLVNTYEVVSSTLINMVVGEPVVSLNTLAIISLHHINIVLMSAFEGLWPFVVPNLLYIAG